MTKPLVLAVEDDKTQQTLLLILASRFGLEIEVVSSAEEALDVIEQNDYALILMDWRLGGELSGLDCTRKIRELEAKKGRHTPIVAVTAKAMKGDRESCLEAGMDDYLSKPFSVESFEETLSKYLGKAALEPAAFTAQASLQDEVSGA